MRFFFDKRSLKSLDEAVDLYKPEEFASPTRSTVPMLSLLKHGGAVLKALLCHVGSADSTTEAHLEFTVGPKQGTGKPSHTDVMVISEERAIAIEAKWTESRYDEVSVWLERGSSAQNRRNVMNGWLSLLQPDAAKKLCLDDFSSAVYQMVHRAASVYSAGRLPTLLYVQFCPLPDRRAVESSLMDDLHHLHALLGSPVAFPFLLAEVEAMPTSAFERIRSLPKGIPQTAETVRAALQGEPLFAFTNITFLPVKTAGCQ
jgi:hypothetical protein